MMVRLLGALATWLSAVGSALACSPIERVPVRLDDSGCFRLDRNLSLDDPVADTAIAVMTDNVTIDLGGFTISTPRDPDGRRVGIYSSERKGLTIRNGTLKGFFYGIRVDGGEGPRIENLHLEANTFRGLAISASDATIADNMISETGGTRVYPDAFAIGIEVIGPGCSVIGNTVVETYAVGIGEGVGISLSSNNAGCSVEKNRVSNARLDKQTRSFALWIGLSPDRSVHVLDNDLGGMTYPFWTLRERTRPWPDNLRVNFRDNRVRGVECSPHTLPEFFRGLDASNTFAYAGETCPDVIPERRRQLQAAGPDSARTWFALAAVKEQEFTSYIDQHGVASSEALESMAKAITSMERAAELGLAEAARVLPRLRATYESAPRGLRN
jgi:hypothetical protein